MNPTNDFGKGLITKTLATSKNPDIIPLPIFYCENEKNAVLSCWKMSFKERLFALLFGKVFICQKTNADESINPIWAKVIRKEVFL